ncbi:MAG: hypothetical protein RJA29_2095 [Pseudomonadota bacterium]|jgi:hypothetical protein
MNDIASLATQAIHNNASQPQPKADNPVIRKLFLVLHGSYGNLFTSKFSTGERDANGKDKGIRAAMLVWESALSKYPADVIETAAMRLTTECPDFPPNLPQFEAICKAVMPRKTYAEEQGLVRLPAPAKQSIGPVEYEVKNDGKDWARRIMARHEAGERLNPTTLRFAREALNLSTFSFAH